jgi:hypothetical protein
MTVLVYRYAVKGRIPDVVIDEIRRGHILRNQITEIYRAADEQVAALYTAQPGIADVQETAEAARRHVQELRDQIQAGKADGRTRRPDPDLAARLAAARQDLTGARAALRTAKAAVRDTLKPQEKAIRDQAYTAVRALYPQAVSGILFEGTPAPGAVYWATFNMVAAQQRAALGRVIQRRAEGQPAELGFRRWEGEGTIAVQLQRGAGDPPRSPAMLADPGAGKWRNVALLTPGLDEAAWAALPPAERKRAELRFRVGSGDTATMETLRIVLHRPVPDGADITRMQVTVRRVTSTRVKASIALTLRTPDPQPRAGGQPAAAHTGWRVLNDGSIRVAVIAGATSPPPGTGLVKDVGSARTRLRARLAGTRSGVPARPWAGGPAGPRESGIRDHGTWQEIVIPASIRGTDEHVRSLQSIRTRELERARAAIAAHLAQHPDSKEVIDPDGTLDRWRSPRRFTRALEALETSDPPQHAADLLAVLRAWRDQERHLEAWQVHERQRHITGWRRDMYRTVAAWLADTAGVIIVDSWPAVRLRPAAQDEDTPQMAAARANAVLAAPGELRHAIEVASARRGVTVQPGPAGAGSVHFGCPGGGELPAEERALHVVVTCRGCGRQVDQDRNMLAAMLASAE